MSVVGQGLPASVTPLIGRENDLRAVAALLGDRRLVTLVGPPGIGKTRLALGVGAAGRGFPGGTWFVDLARIAEPALVDQALAAAVPAREEPGRPLRETLLGWMVGDRRLVILDNCEHVIDAAAGLAADLLAHCPELAILATSRESLAITGETIWRVPPLETLAVTQGGAVPPTGDAPSAFRLFCERARAVQPGFAPSAAVAEICRRLDGVPLAIELAAARVDTLSAAEIVERLADPFDLLCVGSRTAIRRHQTLRAALEWSYDLLSGPEQLVFRRLAVFAGGWCAEAAEDVCASEDLDASDVLPLLGRLVAKSLVMTEMVGMQRRFRCLETVRQFARERLDESAETFAVSTRHATWMAGLCEEAGSYAQGSQPDPSAATIDGEYDNVQAALRWAVDESQAVLALRLATGMTMYWAAHGSWCEGRQWLLAAAATPGAATAPQRPAALWGAGFLLAVGSDWLAAHDLVTQSLALAEEAGDRLTQARSLFIQGVCALFLRGQGSPVALARFNRSAVVARAASDAWCLTCALAGLAWVRNVQCDPSAARSIMQECLAVARQAQDPQSLASAIQFLGLVALRQRDLATAEVILSEAARLARALGDLRLAAEAAHALGVIALERDDLDRASRQFDHGLACARQLGTSAPLLNGLWGRAEVARRQGDLAMARSSFTEAVSLAWQIGGHCRPALIGLARVSLAAGDPWGGEALLDQTVAEGIPDDAHAQALHEKGALARARGELGKAAALHQEALTAWAEVRDPIGIAQSLEQLAGIAASEGRPAHAACLFGAAHAARDGTHFPYPPSRDGAQYTKDVALARDRLASEDFDKAWDDGVRLSTDEAIRFASFGFPAQDRPCAGWASLTRAERAVAALVAESLTNREIGTRLFISPRTVQTHLSHVFSKLGFSSRRDLARLVARRRAHTPSP